MRLKAYAPTGAPIIGTSDFVPACALAEVFKDSPDGELQVEFEGESKLYWDGQTQNTDDQGRELYQDDDGGEWAEEDLVFLDPEAHDHDVTVARMAREWEKRACSRAAQANGPEVPHA